MSVHLPQSAHKLHSKAMTMPEAQLRLRDQHGNRTGFHPTDADYSIISAYAHGASPWNTLSPQHPNPFSFEDEKGVWQSALVFENMWQAMAVYRRVTYQSDMRTGWRWPDEIHIDYTTLTPNEKWHKWNEALTRHTKAVTRPNGSQIPLYMWFKGRRIGFVEARKTVYIPYLQNIYRQNYIYQCVLRRFVNGDNLVILAQHGPSQIDYPQGRNMTYTELIAAQDVVDAPYGTKAVPLYGHGHVLAQTLFEDRAVCACTLVYPPSPPLPSSKRTKSTPETDAKDDIPLGI